MATGYVLPRREPTLTIAQVAERTGPSAAGGATAVDGNITYDEELLAEQPETDTPA